MDTELTEQQAARLLNVSAHTLTGLIDDGTLPAIMIGDQRLLSVKAVLACKRDRQANRHIALDALAASDQELGLR